MLTPVLCVKLSMLALVTLLALAAVRARPGSTSTSATGTRHERQDLRMLPANATGTPQDQALAGGVVPEEGSSAQGAAMIQDSMTSTAQPSKGSDMWRKLSSVGSAGTGLPSVSGPSSFLGPPGSPGPSGFSGTPGLSVTTLSTSTTRPSATTATVVAPVHGQDRTKSHSGPASDFAGEDSNIVFPSPPIKIDVGLPDQTKFDPFSRTPTGRAPSCAKGSTFCTDVDHYPENYLQTMLRSAAVGLGYKEYFGNDVVESNITQRIDAMDENPLCPYEETLVYPKVAKNKDDKWLYVVNQDHYVQGVRIETCLNPGTPCQLAENFPYGYTTSCRQKYILRKLVALNPEGQTQTDMFRLPSCCSCYVTRSNVSSRRSNMTPAITKSGNPKR